jgi:5-methylcytosine-specific restriction endonuclease McrA
MTQYKTCSKCLQTKPFEEFGNHKNMASGKDSSCFICKRLARASYRARYKNAIKIEQADNYRRNRDARLSAASKRYVLNPQKAKDAAQKWQKQNPEYFAAYQRKRTAKKHHNDFRYVTRKELVKMYKSACIYCGSKKSIEIDHVIPIARGGRHAIGNLAPACMSCNRSKHSLFIMEWRIKRQKNPPKSYAT